MSTVVEQVEVQAAIGTVFDCWSRFESFPTFMGGVDAVERIDADRTRWVVAVGGVRRAFETVLTGRIPNALLSWETVEGEVQHQGEIRFEPVADGAGASDTTHIEVRLEWEPFGVLEHTGRALGLDRRQIRADLHRFKELVETEPRRAAAIAGVGARHE
jgi:uncharacterized membrane protein